MLRWVFVFLVVPLQAAALSCMPWDVENAFLQADEHPEPYLIVKGRLTFSEAELPKVDWNNQQIVPPKTQLDARFEGATLAVSGKGTSYSGPVTLSIFCAGPWCPSARSGVETLAFVRRSTDGDVITQGPCGGMLFQNPSPGQIRRVKSCLKGGDCAPRTR